MALAVALAAAILAAPASATRINGPEKYQEWTDASRISTVPGAVRVIAGPCPVNPEWSACSYRDGPIYMQSWAGPMSLWHELGHRFDYELLTRKRRLRVRRLLGQPPTARWRTSGEFSSPVEQFAEAYSHCARVGPGGGAVDEPTHELQLTRDQHRLICAMIERVATRSRPS